MNAEDRLVLRALLDRQVLTVGVVVDGAPVLGLMPCVRASARPDVLVHGSKLAKHSRALGSGGPVAVLMHADEATAPDPLQLPRLSLKVDAVVLEGDAYLFGRQRFIERFPSSAQTFGLGDFQLFELRVREGRLVAGFGRAFTVSREVLTQVLQGESRPLK